MNQCKAVFVILCLLLLSVLEAGAERRMMSVQVKTTQLRSSPSFLGKPLQALNYGVRLAVVSQKGDWLQVSPAPGMSGGWVHGSALTPKRIEFRAGEQNVSQAATSDELALAGKGFNAQVEAQFKAQNPRLNFAPIDQMETIRISQSEIQAFIQKGRLHLSGGVQ